MHCIHADIAGRELARNPSLLESTDPFAQCEGSLPCTGLLVDRLIGCGAAAMEVMWARSTVELIVDSCTSTQLVRLAEVVLQSEMQLKSAIPFIAKLVGQLVSTLTYLHQRHSCFCAQLLSAAHVEPLATEDFTAQVKLQFSNQESLSILTSCSASDSTSQQHVIVISTLCGN